MCYRKQSIRRKRPFKTILIQPDDSWPIPNKGDIVMICDYLKRSPDVEPDGSKWFVFEHSVKYQKTHKLFLEKLKMGNVDVLMRLFIDHPYHLELLIHLSEICK